ncbi:MAG: DNA polymerase III subunit gamma/tau [Vicinamibacteria bacterium]|nr:DNA polymerase III subunit gamma/tau [Vicinamibacteria bacterium]
MSYLVLARKWRPRTFDEIVGQETVVRTLKNALVSGRIGHAFLLSGARGVGKTTTARILAKALNCSQADKPTSEPCGRCSSCEEIATGTALDVQEIDGATHNGVEQVRELRESARYNPARDRFKIWIIDEVHMLSTGAFNALLKTLEEPPPRVKFIFATTEYHKIPDTILSRCQQYDFRMIPARELADHLRRVAQGEEVRISDEAVGRIARAAEGSVRDALSLFDQVLSFSGDTVRDEDIQALLGLIDRDLLLAASRAIAESDSVALLELVERLSEYGADYRNFARELLLHFREILLGKMAPANSALLVAILPDELQSLKSLAESFSEEDLLRFFDVLVKVEADLRWAQDPRVTLEIALLKMSQMRRLLPFAELVARVERLPGGETAAPDGAERVASAPKEQTVSRPRTARRESPPRSQSGEPVDPAVAEPAGILGEMMALAKRRPSLLQPLRAARASIDGSTLTLAVQEDFLAFTETHIEEYRDLARRAGGQTLAVKVEHANREEKQESAEESERRGLLERAQSDPAVQQALDLFGGRIVDVRKEPSRSD